MAYKVLYLLVFFSIALTPRSAIGNEPLLSSHMGEEGDEQYSKIIEEAKSALLECIIDNKYESFVGLWEKNNQYVTSNKQLQEILIWHSFIEKKHNFFEYIVRNIKAPCSSPCEYPLIYPLLSSSDKRDRYFLETLLKYNNNPYGFADGLDIIYREPSIGVGMVTLNNSRALMSNVLFYYYHLNWKNLQHRAKAEKEWREILNLHPVANHFMNGFITPLPSNCPNEDIVFIIDNLFLPLDKLEYLFSNISVDRIITEQDETPLQYATRTKNWLFVKLFMELEQDINSNSILRRCRFLESWDLKAKAWISELTDSLH